MTTITRELIAAYLNGEVKTLTNSEQKELARIALASLDAGSNSHPAHGPLSNYRLYRIREILSKAAAQRDGGNLGYGMSDAVKAIDELLEGRKVEPVAWTDEQELIDVEKDGLGYLFTVNPITPHADPRRVIKLYRHAQPAPVVPDRFMFEIWWESENGTPLDSWDSLRTTDGYCYDGIDGQFDAWNACRAAMLNGGKS